MQNFASRLFWATAAVLFAAYALRYAYETILPLFWLACPLLVVGVGGWLYFSWRRRW